MPLPPIGSRLGLWLLKVSRAEVERQESVPAILNLAPEHVKSFHRKMELFIDGYDDDPRDLYAIDEVRSWVQMLDIALPFWFFLLSLGGEVKPPVDSVLWMSV